MLMTMLNNKCGDLPSVNEQIGFCKIIDKIFLLPISVVRLLYFVDMITIFILIILWKKLKALNNSSIAIQKA